MIYSTRGIVLHQISYGETSVITKVYTELFGLQTYIINGVRTRKAKIKTNILQPLSLLDMEVYNRDNRSLQRVKDASAVNPSSPIGLDMVKGSLAIFVAEVLFRSIREEEPNQELFDFLIDFIENLEMEEGSVANHHLIFMLQLTSYLGFYPSAQGAVPMESGSTCFFDKREGVFCKEVPPHGDWMDEKTSGLLQRIMQADSSNISDIKISSAQRNDMINHLIAYYNLHLDTRIDIKSHKVLQTVMQ